MPKDVWDLKFQASYNLPIIIIMEAFECSWNRIYKISQDLISAFSTRINTFYFLGDKNPYFFSTDDNFADRAPGIFTRNKNRVLLLNPILERLKDFAGNIVVLCSKVPVDLEDWMDTEIINQILFINLGGESFPDQVNVLNNPNINYIKDKLFNPIERIWISAPDFLPLAYEIRQGGNAKVFFENGEFQIRVKPEGVSLELHLKALANEEPSLFIQRHIGKLQKISGEKENPWFSELKWETLNESISPVVEAGIKRTDFICPQCGNKHSYETLICPEGTQLLEGIPCGVSILIRKKGKKFEFLAITDYALSIKDGDIVITRDGRIYIQEKGSWKIYKENIFYDEVDDGLWALYH